MNSHLSQETSTGAIPVFTSLTPADSYQIQTSVLSTVAAGHLNKCHGTLAAFAFSHTYKPEGDAVNCCTVLLTGEPMAGRPHAELSGSLRQSAGWPKPSRGPSGRG